jgi:hypothetical protein
MAQLGARLVGSFFPLVSSTFHAERRMNAPAYFKKHGKRPAIVAFLDGVTAAARIDRSRRLSIAQTRLRARRFP